MSPVLGKKTVKALLEILEGDRLAMPREPYLVDELQRALKPKRSVRLARARKAESDAEAQAEWERVRAQVLMRAGGHCENCGAQQERLAADHMFGGNGRRLTLQSKFTVWALCFRCDGSKTRNEPSASDWLAWFANWAQRKSLHPSATQADINGYEAAGDLAKARLESLMLQGRS